jgi:hypothetical protein
MAAGLYPCLAADAPIVIDGDLGEWRNAVPAACGATQRSTGEIAP